jgi:hypothetical protein
VSAINLKTSKGLNDIDEVMKIVATFGAGAEDLLKIKEYICSELRELSGNGTLYLLECGSETVRS